MVALDFLDLFFLGFTLSANRVGLTFNPFSFDQSSRGVCVVSKVGNSGMELENAQVLLPTGVST